MVLQDLGRQTGKSSSSEMSDTRTAAAIAAGGRLCEQERECETDDVIALERQRFGEDTADAPCAITPLMTPPASGRSGPGSAYQRILLGPDNWGPMQSDRVRRVLAQSRP